MCRVFDDPCGRSTGRRCDAGAAGRPKRVHLAGMDCKQVGWAVQQLGAGRARPGDPVSAHAGIESHAKIGDWVEAGQTVFTLFSEDEGLLAEPYEMLEETVRIEARRTERLPLVREIVLR